MVPLRATGPNIDKLKFIGQLSTEPDPCADVGFTKNNALDIPSLAHVENYYG
jgi:hypothetical protein